MIKDFETFDFQILNEETFSWQIHKVEDHTPVLKENWKNKQSGTNGWTPGRKTRQIARIPTDALELAERMGYDMKSMEGIYKFLHDYPKFRTVPHIKSPTNGSAQSQGKIIVH